MDKSDEWPEVEQLVEELAEATGIPVSEARARMELEVTKLGRGVQGLTFAGRHERPGDGAARGDDRRAGQQGAPPRKR